MEVLNYQEGCSPRPSTPEDYDRWAADHGFQKYQCTCGRTFESDGDGSEGCGCEDYEQDGEPVAR